MTTEITTTRGSYWHNARRPLCSLIFVAPWVLLYENETQVSSAMYRNGADAWLRAGLEMAGLSWNGLPPLLLMVLLIAWQWIERHPWQIRWDTLWGMAAESSLFAFGLILFGQGWQAAIASCTAPGEMSPFVAVGGSGANLWVRFVSFLGAGIYEEFLFRLCAIPLVFGVLRAVRLPARWSALCAIVLTSLTFSLAHYVNLETPEIGAAVSAACARLMTHPELWSSFGFRFIAGLMFGALFVLRGFGIAAGAHAIYDISVGIVMLETL